MWWFSSNKFFCPKKNKQLFLTFKKTIFKQTAMKSLTWYYHTIINFNIGFVFYPKIYYADMKCHVQRRGIDYINFQILILVFGKHARKDKLNIWKWKISEKLVKLLIEFHADMQLHIILWHNSEKEICLIRWKISISILMPNDDGLLVVVEKQFWWR